VPVDRHRIAGTTARSVALFRDPSRFSAIRRAFPRSVALFRDPSRFSAIRRAFPRSVALSAVEPIGFEPTTLGLQSRCSPS
jgi:hypothetical protein